jgi:CPA1 family monovalent cation:H+ antiporter
VPIILFEESFNAKYHMFERVFWQVMVLGIPCFLVTCSISAFGFHYLIGDTSDLTWSAAFTVGAIVSITDTAECVNVLERLKASHKFLTLIEIESLVNDGSGIIFFHLFSELAKESSEARLTPGYVATTFIWEGFAALLFGYFSRQICEKWLRHVHNDKTNTINITFVITYLAYSWGEWEIGVSGILTVVTLGLGLSKV